MSTISLSRQTLSPHTLTGTARRTIDDRRGRRTIAVRLTRRGRLAIVTVASAALATLAIAFGPSVVATGDSGVMPATTVVTVEPGQTLWQIAAAANPDADVRETVDDIMRMNSLSSPTLAPGADLAVPVYE